MAAGLQFFVASAFIMHAGPDLSTLSDPPPPPPQLVQAFGLPRSLCARDFPPVLALLAKLCQLVVEAFTQRISVSCSVGAHLFATCFRTKFYKSDWSDGFNRKSLPAIMFLYFACLLPAVAFGGIATQVLRTELAEMPTWMPAGYGRWHGQQNAVCA